MLYKSYFRGNKTTQDQLKQAEKDMRDVKKKCWTSLIKEETEVKKNIEWLKREIHKELESWQGVEGGIDEDGINEIMLLIDQLDEAEVLSHELPVIPGYVAEWIDTNKEKYDLVQLFWEIGEGGLVNLDVDRWIEENPHTFARAWLDGYTVEEKKYKVLIGKAYEGRGLFLSKSPHDGTVTIGTNLDYFRNRENNKETHLTEQEIKDYDERYWPFAVKVEEMEE